MKLYAVNYYVGGTPMDGETLGVFDCQKQARKCFLKNLKEFDIDNESIEEQSEDYIYWDMDDCWGGIKIEELKLNH